MGPELHRDTRNSRPKWFLMIDNRQEPDRAFSTPAWNNFFETLDMASTLWHQALYDWLLWVFDSNLKLDHRTFSILILIIAGGFTETPLSLGMINKWNLVYVVVILISTSKSNRGTKWHLVCHRPKGILYHRAKGHTSLEIGISMFWVPAKIKRPGRLRDRETIVKIVRWFEKSMSRSLFKNLRKQETLRV